MTLLALAKSVHPWPRARPAQLERCVRKHCSCEPNRIPAQTAERPNRRPESWRFARPARDCGPADFGIRQGRGAQPRGFCTRIRAVACQMCWHFCGKTWVAAAQRQGGSHFGRISAARSLPQISQISEAQSLPEISQKFAGFRSLSHMEFQKHRKEFNEKLRGQHSNLPWKFSKICQGL